VNRHTFPSHAALSDNDDACERLAKFHVITLTVPQPIFSVGSVDFHGLARARIAGGLARARIAGGLARARIAGVGPRESPLFDPRTRSPGV
jgi:hypothetical protein